MMAFDALPFFWWLFGENETHVYPSGYLSIKCLNFEVSDISTFFELHIKDNDIRELTLFEMGSVTKHLKRCYFLSNIFSKSIM